NLGDTKITDKMTGLNAQQKEYLQKWIDKYKGFGWEIDDYTYTEISGNIMSVYNNEESEEKRVMLGSETSSGKLLGEGTRSNYATGVTGVYKSKGIKSTEEATTTDAEKKLIEDENARIKGK
ncbi:MAG TPA: hypothetical protein VFJ43_05595, partial [Bacteroidia bacterium]|nr:hypothetical protein [Bacteroidia bacterium]